MQFELWAVVIGSPLITMAMLATPLRPLPLSTAMLYLAVGFALGPAGLDVLSPDPLMHAEVIERMAELAIVTVLGALLSPVDLRFGAAAFGLFLLLFVRPLSVWLGLIRARVSGDQRVLIAWFGIRGIGSIYYLMYAINHGLPAPLAHEICTLTLTAVALSIVLHGVSVTPLMRRYMRRKSRLSSPPAAQ